MQLKAVLCVVVLTSVLLAVAVLPQAAEAKFTCVENWKKKGHTASDNNDVADCDIPNAYLDDKPVVAAIVFPSLILGFTLLCYIPAFCGRKCCQCCGGNRRRPGEGCCGGSDWDEKTEDEKDLAYAEKNRCGAQFTKGCTFTIWIIAIGCMIAMLMGAVNMRDGYLGIFDSIGNFLDWVDATATTVKANMTDPYTGQLIPPLTPQYFVDWKQKTDDIRADIKDKRKEFKTDYYVLDIGQTISLCVAIVPNVLLIFGVFFAVFDIRKCGPSCMTCFFFLFIILYCAVGIIFTTVGVLVRDVCIEVDMHMNDQPDNFLNWYLVARCKQTLPFDAFKEQITNAEVDNSISACTSLQSMCDATTAFSTSFPDKVWICNITNATRECNTLAKFRVKFDTTELKTGATECTACSIEECATKCASASVRQKSNDTVSSLVRAERALNTFHGGIAPLLDCNFVFKRALQDFNDVCPVLRDGFLEIGVTATLYGFLFGLAIIAMFRGQKHFFKMPSADDDDDDYAEKKNQPDYDEGENQKSGKTEPYAEDNKA